MFYQRKIYPELKKHLKQKQITVITGMRRVGKTTILKRILEEIASDNKGYFDLERVDLRELFAEKNYDLIISALKNRGLNLKEKLYLAIDEIQLAPSIVSALKYLYDNYKIKFIVSGSSSFYLKNFFSESLSGRKKIFELFPLDFSEFLTFKEISFKKTDNIFRTDFERSEFERLKSLYEEFVAFGGFPEVVLSKTIQAKKDLLNDIISSYINIDIATLSDFRQQNDFYALIKMLVARCGSRLDYTKLSQLTGISRPTLMNYLEFLEKTYLISRLPVLTGSFDREIVKAKKIYFCDTGLANVLAQLSSGQQFENTIFNQLRSSGDLRYFALKTGREIDFILDSSLALEVKETPTISDLKNINELAKVAKIKKSRLIGRYSSPKFQNYTWAGLIR